MRIRATVSKVLGMEGFTVIEAEGAQECLRLLENGFRGVILMDVMMPGKDGWDLIREMKESELLEGNIIVMLTAVDQPCKRMDGLQELVIDYITKPFVSKELISSVNKCLGYLADAGIEER
jgi:DNA-binding response OmpR family regulator